MAPSALGTKRHCQSCDGKFYDLNKDPIKCPLCNELFDPEVLLKSRRSKPVVAAQSKPAEPETESNDKDNLNENIDDVDTAIENDSEVLEDDSDLVAVGGGRDEDEETTSKEMPIEDNLDAVDSSDDDEDDEDPDSGENGDEK